MLGPSRGVATVAIVAVLGAVLGAAPAAAQPAPAPTPAQKKQAQDLVKQAIRRSEAKDHAGAIALYQQAYALVPLPTLLSNIATEHLAGGDVDAALAEFCRYLAADPAGPLSAYVRAQVREIHDAQGHPTRELCTPLPAPVITAPAPPVDPATAPVPPPPPPAVDRGRPLRIAGLATGGAGLVALGAGVVFGLRARSISDDISRHPVGEPWRDDIAAYQADGERAETLQIVGLAAGGALVIGGAALYLLGRGRASAAGAEVAVTPAALHGGGGLVVGGRF